MNTCGLKNIRFVLDIKNSVFFSGVFTWDSDFTCNSHPQQKNEGSVQYSSKTNRYFYSFKVNIYNCVFFMVETKNIFL